jgi:hypothetical protein
VNVAEVLLVFVGIPLLVIAVLALLIWGPGGRKRPRYRPGQPWEHAPIWYEPHPGAPGGSGNGHGDGGSHALALEGSTHVVHTPSGGPLGGARGTW